MTATKTQTANPTTSTDQQQPLDLEALKAQKKIIDEQIKAARAAQPRRDRLSAENEREINKSWRGSLAAAYKRRINAGQSSTDAITAILAATRAALDAIALPTSTDTSSEE